MSMKIKFFLKVFLNSKEPEEPTTGTGISLLNCLLGFRMEQ